MDIAAFMESFGLGLGSLFGDGLLFLGLQGSHGRGEACESSDIDPVVILEKCGRDELLRYRSFIDSLPEKDIICGFVASVDELDAWDGADRACLILDTRPVIGNLASLCPAVTVDDIKKAVLQGACAIFHASSHNILHARDWSMLPDLYKSVRCSVYSSPVLVDNILTLLEEGLLDVLLDQVDSLCLRENICDLEECSLHNSIDS